MNDGLGAKLWRSYVDGNRGSSLNTTSVHFSMRPLETATVPIPSYRCDMTITVSAH